MFNCSIFYIKILEKCINNLKTWKDSVFTFDEDYQDIILKRRKINVNIYNSNDSKDIYLDVNDNLNFILSKGIKLIGSYEDYIFNKIFKFINKYNFSINNNLTFDMIKNIQ